LAYFCDRSNSHLRSRFNKRLRKCDRRKVRPVAKYLFQVAPTSTRIFTPGSNATDNETHGGSWRYGCYDLRVESAGRPTGHPVASSAVIFAFYRLVVFQWQVERTNLRIGLPVYRPGYANPWIGTASAQAATLPSRAFTIVGSSTAMSRTYHNLRIGLPVYGLAYRSVDW
jgi:hypothetical protein